MGAPVAESAGPGDSGDEPERSFLSSILLFIIGAQIAVGVIVFVGFLLAQALGLSASAMMTFLQPAQPAPAATVVTPTPVNTALTPAPASPPRRPALQSKAITSRAWSMWKDVSVDLLDPAVEVERSFQPLRTFPAGFDIIEGGTIQSDQTRIRLAGIISPSANAVCMSDQSTKFACGLMARASLSVFASGEKLLCYPDVAIDTENPQFLCQSRGRDLSLAQIEAGYAFPAQPSLDELVQLAAKARAERLGAWNGDWNIIPPGGAPVTPKDVAP